MSETTDTLTGTPGRDVDPSVTVPPPAHADAPPGDAVSGKVAPSESHETSSQAPGDSAPSAPGGSGGNADAAGRSRRIAGLTSMNVPQLHEVATALGITGTARMRKNDLISAIREQQSGGQISLELPVTTSAPSAGGSTGRTRRAATRPAGPPTDHSTDHPVDAAAVPAPAVQNTVESAPLGSTPTVDDRTASTPVLTAPAVGTPEVAPAPAESAAPTASATAPAETATATEQATAPATAGTDTVTRPRRENQRRDNRDRDNRGGGDNRDRGENRGSDNRGSDNRSGENRSGENRDRGENRGGENRGGENRGGENRGENRDRGDREGGQSGQQGNRDRTNQRDGNRDNRGDRGDSQQRTQQRDNRDTGPRDDDEDGEGGRRRGRRFRDRRGRTGTTGGGQRDRFGGGEAEPVIAEDDVLVPVAGILDILDNYAFVRTSGYLPGSNDVYVSLSQVRKNGLRRGDAITGAVRQPRDGERRDKFNALVRLDSVNGMEPDQARGRAEFLKLTPLYPQDRLRLETESNILTTRVIDLVMPIGKGQRALIVSPPKAGKTMVLQAIANAITHNNPECHLMVVLVDERPEEVTDMQRSVKGEVIASTFDRPPSDHTTVAELSIERAKRLVELGHDVVVLLDSITRLGRAYNNASPASGRILSGGIDSTALYPPKRFLGAARNIENGGSLTILATALVETGSTGDTVIFEEFKGTGNAELKLDRKIADRRVFPAVDIPQSSTRKEEILMAPEELAIVIKLRRVLHALDAQQGIDLLLDRLKESRTNIEFLMQVQKTTVNSQD